MYDFMTLSNNPAHPGTDDCGQIFQIAYGGVNGRYDTYMGDTDWRN